MAAGVAARHNDVLKAFYQRLRAAGKCHNVAVTAVMRKLFHYANVVAGACRRSLEAPPPKPRPFPRRRHDRLTRQPMRFETMTRAPKQRWGE
jgi:hypothetical protein